MSADNGIYILWCADGYRVAHCQAIENIYWQCRRKNDIEFNNKYLYDYFHTSKVFMSRGEAFEEAERLYKEIISDDICPICKYGIVPIGSGNFIFPIERPPCCDNPAIVSIDGEVQCYNCGEYLED